MFDMSLGEFGIILFVALIVLGPEKLPDAARRIGKIVGELKRTSDGFRREFYNAVYTPAEELKKIERGTRNLITAKDLGAGGQSPDCPDFVPPDPGTKSPDPEKPND